MFARRNLAVLSSEIRQEKGEEVAGEGMADTGCVLEPELGVVEREVDFLAAR